MDREFNFIIPDFPYINTNPTAKSDHVPETERQIRVIKERARSIRIKITFQRLPNRIIVDMMNFWVMWINDFTVKSGVSKTYSPQIIMTGISLDWTKHCKAEFGA